MDRENKNQEKQNSIYKIKMSSKAQYVIKQINNVSQADRYTVCRIAVFRGYKLRQSNNGAYIQIKEIDENTLNEIYNFLKYKLNVN